MLKCERSEVLNMENALRGARNPMNSWDKQDSYYDSFGDFVIGPNDLALAVKLRKAGPDHRKYLRQVFVTVDITAPLYWWKEYDTYKVATVANSTSTMHKIHAKEITVNDFSHEMLNPIALDAFKQFVETIESIRKDYMASGKPKDLWYNIIQMLPSSYEQMRTCTLNYETLINIYHARKEHKLDEWHVLCAWIETLPYANELIICKQGE